MNKEKKIEELFDKGILINERMLDQDIGETLLEKIHTENDLLVLNDDYAKIIQLEGSLIDWYEIDKHRVDVEKERDDELYQSQLQQFKECHLQLHSSTQSTNIDSTQKITSIESELDENSSSFSFSS